MSEPPPPSSRSQRGFGYWVSDEQLAVFSSLTPDARLRWVDEMRELTCAMAPPEAKAWWRRLRAGR